MSIPKTQNKSQDNSSIKPIMPINLSLNNKLKAKYKYK